MPIFSNKLRYLLLLLFLGAFGFAGGSLYFLGLMVPVEEWMQQRHWSQGAVDWAMRGFIGLWGAICLTFTWQYDRRLLRVRRGAALAALIGVSLGAGFIFRSFLQTDSALVARFRSTEETVASRLTFGPYPDEEALRHLKREGYAAVITLLHPSIPFEKTLLEREQQSGERAGLAIHSIPLLPWVADGQAALSQLIDLVQKTPGKIYLHCYLGQHRVDLARQALLTAMGQKSEIAKEPLPPSLERGKLLALPDESILIGPYPTDEEWFHILLRRQVKAVLLTLSPEDPENQPWIEKARQIANQYEIQLTLLPLVPEDRASMRRLIEAVQSHTEKRYVMGFHSGAWAESLHQSLLTGQVQVPTLPLPAALERGALLKVDERITLGPYPTPDEVALLKKAGIEEVISLLDAQSPENERWISEEKNWAAESGFTLTGWPLLSEPVAPSALADLARHLQASERRVYIHAFLSTDARLQQIYDFLRVPKR